MLLRLLILFLLVLPVSASPRTVRLAVTADAGVWSERGHLDENSGASVTVPIRQNQNWSGFETKAYLMRFDTEALRGMTVTRAWLNLFVARGELYAVGLCTVLADWDEGSGVNGQTGRGGASWNWAREPEDGESPGPHNYWAWPGSAVYSVSWAHPDARYHHAGPLELEKRRLDNGILHLRFPVAPELVEALGTGLAYGLVLTDDKGQVAEGLSLKGSGKPYRYDRSQDIYIYTRDVQDPSLRPFLEVEGEVVDKTPPGGVGEPEIIATEPGDRSVTVAFTAPADDGNSGGAVLGYEVRYSSRPLTEYEWKNASRLPLWAVPLPSTPGTRQSLRVFTLPPGNYHLGIRAVDEAGNRGPVSQCAITIPVPPEANLKVPAAERKKRGSPGAAIYENLLEVWVCPDICKVDPLSGGILLDGRNYEPAGEYKLENEVWWSARRTVRLEAARGEVVAFQIILERVGQGKLTGVRVVPDDFIGAPGIIKAEGNISCFRVWYFDVASRKEEGKIGEGEKHLPVWHGDACLLLAPPFAESFSLPSMDNLGEDQRCQSVWVDFYLPPQTKPGLYQGKVTITAHELKRPVIIIVELKVLPLVMPAETTWTVELNAYHYGLNHMFGVSVEKDPKRYLTIERRCYQMAHQHRTTLNILPYGQDGKVQAGCAPVLSGRGKDIRVVSWKEWDRRFADYLNGKAFTAGAGYRGPGERVPVSHMYLPFEEDWPLPAKEYYTDWADLRTRDQYVEWAKTSRPLEEAFSSQYQEGFVSVVRQFFEHFKKKGFTRTSFQAYFNNKYYFKCNFFQMSEEGRGSSFWLLDEPVDYDDYAANRFFLSLIKKGYEQAGAPGVKIHYRTDVSQPQMSRGLWDGICNLWNTSSLFPYASTAAFRMQRLPGEQYWHYGGGPGISAGLIGLQKNFFTYWSIGTVGDLPYWNTLAGDSWVRPNDLAILYTGTDYARTGKNHAGPFASVRLKAIRRAQQDIEYLNMLCAKKGWNRWKVRKAIAPWADDPQAEVLSFQNLKAEELFELRKALVAALLEK